MRGGIAGIGIVGRVNRDYVLIMLTFFHLKILLNHSMNVHPLNAADVFAGVL